MMETIIELERVAAAHWRGTEEQWLGKWLLRAAEGFTGRANSVLPLGDPGMPLDEALAAVTQWYRDRGLPPMIVVPVPLEPDPAGQALDNHLSERNWLTRPGPAFVMVADLSLGGLPPVSLPAGRAVQLTREPDDAWAARYHYRGQDHLPPIAGKVLTSAEEQWFVSIREGDDVLAIARLSVAAGWAGLTAVEVNPAYRRQGLGVAITAAACREAGPRGIRNAFLQVEVDNAPARALYERLGFRYSHRYHYRVSA
jgi:GNAT superfamily N-acetyltransferase